MCTILLKTRLRPGKKVKKKTGVREFGKRPLRPGFLPKNADDVFQLIRTPILLIRTPILDFRRYVRQFLLEKGCKRFSINTYANFGFSPLRTPVFA
jgi:hypothetical protein